MMTLVEVEAYLIEFDRRWRSRTPATDIEAVLPQTRVGRSEMRAWFIERFGRDMTLDDTIHLELPMKALFRKLKREFPNERWP